MRDPHRGLRENAGGWTEIKGQAEIQRHSSQVWSWEPRLGQRVFRTMPRKEGSLEKLPEGLEDKITRRLRDRAAIRVRSCSGSLRKSHSAWREVRAQPAEAC